MAVVVKGEKFNMATIFLSFKRFSNDNLIWFY